MYGSLGPPESPPQTSLRLVQPFSQGSRSVTDRPTYRQTDHATPSVTIGRIYEVLRCGPIIPLQNNKFLYGWRWLIEKRKWGWETSNAIVSEKREFENVNKNQPAENRSAKNPAKAVGATSSEGSLALLSNSCVSYMWWAPVQPCRPASICRWRVFAATLRNRRLPPARRVRTSTDTASGAERVRCWRLRGRLRSRAWTQTCNGISLHLNATEPLQRTWDFELVCKTFKTSGYATWFTAGGAIRIAHYGNCKKMARENFSTGAFYNITKNQDNPIKTVGRDSFLSPQTPKSTSF